MAGRSYPLRARVLRSPLGRRLFGPVVTRRGAGLLIVLLSAVSIGAVTPFARLAFDAGVEVAGLMTIRYGLALVAVIFYLFWRRQLWRLKGRQLRQALGLALALGVLSLAFFGSVRRIPASIAALIYYTYPIIVSVLVYRAWRFKKHHTTDSVTLGGQALSLGGLVLILGFSWHSLDVAGVFLAALSAIIIALIYVFGDQLMRTVPPMVLSLYVALFNTALFAVIGMLRGTPITSLDPAGWMGITGVAIFFTVGFVGMFAGVEMLGASQAACIKNVEPIAAIAFSIVLLGENYGIWQFVGAGVVIAGMIIACRTLSSQHEQDPAYEQSDRGRALSLANCTPLCRLGSRCLLA